MTILKKYEYYFYVYILYVLPISKDKKKFIYLVLKKNKRTVHKIKIRAYSSLVAVDFKMRF